MRYTAGLLARVVRQTVPQVSTPLPTAAGEASRPVGWGRQLDVRVIDAASETANPTAIAAYVAKYATKSSTELGHTLDTRLRTAEEIDAPARCPSTSAASSRPAGSWAGSRTWRSCSCRRWAHMLGFRGHFSTRSRRYSTTLTLLRSARADHQRATAAARHPDRTEESPVDSAAVADRQHRDHQPLAHAVPQSGTGTEAGELASDGGQRARPIVHWLSREEARCAGETQTSRSGPPRHARRVGK